MVSSFISKTLPSAITMNAIDKAKKIAAQAAVDQHLKV